MSMHVGYLGRPKHRLTDVDPEARRATCVVCGPDAHVRIRKTTSTKTYWRCINAPGYDSAHLAYRENQCARCGYANADRRMFDVHHRNGDHRDNRPENLLTLCPICHRAEHLGVPI